jgi:glycosyltransferase involved in cell wall biosynthesis
MRVLFDISILGLGQLHSLSRGGSYRVDQNLAEGLLASPGVELLLCANHSSAAHLGCVQYLQTRPPLSASELLGPVEGRASGAVRRGAVGAYRLARRILGTNALPAVLRSGARLADRCVHPFVSDASPPVDIFHSPAVPLPVQPRRAHSPRRFVTVHDVIHQVLPGMSGAARGRGSQATIDSLGAEDRVLTSSESTRADLCERGVASEERIFVATLGADPRLFHPSSSAESMRAVRERYGIPEGPYLLSVNTPDPRKNLGHTIQAFAAVARQEGMRDLTLVLVGESEPGWRADALEEAPELRGRVIRTGFVDDEELAPLYGGAIAFVFPSLYEGFGLTPLEAMQCGTPVITSNTSALPEVVGDAGILLDPRDGDALSQAIVDVYRDGALRDRMRARSLARAACFSWERCTRETLAAYRTALG